MRCNKSIYKEDNIKKIRFFLIIALIVLTAAAAFGADYYVSVETGGAGRSADNSKAQPWRAQTGVMVFTFHK